MAHGKKGAPLFTNNCNEILLHVLIHRIYTRYLPYFGVISGNFLKCCRHKNGLLKSCSKIGQKLPKAAFTLSSKKLVKLTSQESLRRIGDIGESEFMFPLQIQRKFEKKIHRGCLKNCDIFKEIKKCNFMKTKVIFLFKQK